MKGKLTKANHIWLSLAWLTLIKGKMCYIFERFCVDFINIIT